MWSGHEVVRVGLIGAFVGALGSGSLAAQANQASDPLALVTVREFEKACAAVPVDTTDEDVKRLITLCTVSGDAASWQITGLPGRKLVKEWAKKRARDRALGYDATTGDAHFASRTGLDGASIVGALTNLIVDRAALEFQLKFIDGFKKEACVAPFVTVFDATCKILPGDDFALNLSFAVQLGAAVKQDLRRTPRTAALALISTPDFNTSVLNGGGKYSLPHQDLVIGAYFAGTTLLEILDGRTPLRALQLAGESDRGVVKRRDQGPSEGLMRDALTAADGAVTLPVSAWLYRLALIPRMLPDNGAGPEWPQTDDNHNVVKTLAVNANEWLSEMDVRVNGPQVPVALSGRLIAEINQLIEAMETLRSRIHDRNNPIDLGDYAAAVDAVLGVVEESIETIEVLRQANRHMGPFVHEFRGFAREVVAQHYTDAVVHAILLIDRLRADSLKVPVGLERLMSFVAAAADAHNAEDFQKVLSAFAAPPRSYRSKRVASGYLSLNAYLGGGVMREKANTKANAAGVSAPVGLELGTSLGGVSIGVLVQVLDLSAPASVRIKEGDAVKASPDIGFGQVVAPGAYLMIGWKKSPVSLGFGGAFVPGLRRDAAGNPLDAKRIGAFAAMDVPLLILK